MLINTNELKGAALDWAAAKCEGLSTYIEVVEGFKPSTDWAQGGPIIERAKIGVDFSKVGWVANGDTRTNAVGLGSTPLIAAMRCYVASKLGDEVEIPKELC